MVLSQKDYDKAKAENRLGSSWKKPGGGFYTPAEREALKKEDKLEFPQGNIQEPKPEPAKPAPIDLRTTKPVTGSEGTEGTVRKVPPERITGNLQPIPSPEPIRLGGERDENYRNYLTTNQSRPYDPNINYLGAASGRQEQDVIRLGGERVDPSAQRPGESDFEFERRKSDEAARERQLANRAEDAIYFEQIEINKREAELRGRAEDADYYRLIDINKRDKEIMQRDEDDEFYVRAARKREEQKREWRDEDSEYYDKIAEDNRARELQYRKEDDEYWANINKGRKEEKKKEIVQPDIGKPGPAPPGQITPTPTPQPTPTPTPIPGEPDIPITEPETGRRFNIPSSLLFGLLRTAGYYDEFLTEEEKKKKKK